MPCPLSVGDRIKYWAGLVIVDAVIVDVFYLVGVAGGDGWYLRHSGSRAISNIRRVDAVRLADDFDRAHRAPRPDTARVVGLVRSRWLQRQQEAG